MKDIVLLLCLSLFALCGCATRNPDGTSTPSPWLKPARVQAIAKLAAYVGCTTDLAQHPEHRAPMKLAAAELQVMVDQEKWDAAAVVTVLAGSGLDVFQSSEGTLIAQGSLLVVDALGLGEYDAKSNEHVRALILGLNEGVHMALSRGLDADHGETLGAMKAQAVLTRAQ